MDLLKTVMENAAAECSLAAPAVFYNNTDASYAQLKRYMYDAARECVQRIDWSQLTRDIVISGNGGDLYDLEADFERLPRSDEDSKPSVWSDSMRRAFKPVTSNGQWTVLTANGPTPSYGYRIVGPNIQFTQTITSGETVTMSYVSNYWIQNGADRVGVWTSDEDRIFLPGKLIELGVIWRWRRKKGLEFNSYLGQFEIELSRYASDDRGIREIAFGQQPGTDDPKSPYDGLEVPLLGQGGA